MLMNENLNSMLLLFLSNGLKYQGQNCCGVAMTHMDSQTSTDRVMWTSVLLTGVTKGCVLNSPVGAA